MQESKLQTKILLFLRNRGFIAEKMEFFHNGYPDIFALKEGKAYFIEVKAEGKKPKPLQLARLEELAKHGANTIWIDSWKSFESYMRDNGIN